MPLAGLLVELDQSVVFHQCYRDFCLTYVNNQVFYRFHIGFFKTKEADPRASLSLADC